MRKTCMFTIDCPVCAGKVERAINKIDGVNVCNISFVAKKMVIDIDDSKYENVKKEIFKISKDVDPDSVIKGL